MTTKAQIRQWPSALLCTAVIGLLPLATLAEKSITITDVKAHNEKSNSGQGFLEDTIDGSGMSLSTPGLPSTWRATTDSWHEEWQCTGGVLNSGSSINSKVGWVVFDLNASHVLENLYLWNCRGTATARIIDYNVYYAVTPSSAVPDGPTGSSTVDYDFASGGWTEVGSGYTMPAKGSTPDAAQSVVSLGSVSAQWVGIEVITYGGHATRLGLAEVGITEVDNTVPTLGSTDIVDDRSGASVEANQFVTYTVTFDEDMDATTITSADFENAGTASFTFSAFSNNTANADAWTVQVQPSTTGTLILQVKSGAGLDDISGNSLNTSSAITDDTTITVTADVTLPTLASTDIVDDRSGASLPNNTLVTYTVTFSEDIDASTVTSADFENGGSATIGFGSITETSPGVFSVPVTPSSGGSLQLQVASGAVIEDLSGNDLNTGSAIADDTTLTVDAVEPTLASTDFVDDRSGASINQYGLVSFTVTFSEDIDDTTVTSADFGNDGTATVSIGNVVETAAGVFTVHAYPTTSGTVQLRVNSGAVIEDVAGNTLDTSSAIVDDTSIGATGISSETLAEVTDVTAYHRGQSAPPGNGSVTTAINGSGMTIGDANDPTTWSRNSHGWHQEWQSTSSQLTPGSSYNNKIGWIAFDLGSTHVGVQNLFLWNCRSSNPAIEEYNLYISSSPSVALPATSSSNTDYDFASGGWTKLNPTIPMILPYDTSGSPQRIVNLDAVTARYIALEVMTVHGDGYTSRIGFAEVGVTKDNFAFGSLMQFR